MPGDKLPTTAVEPVPDCVGVGDCGTPTGVAYKSQLPLGKPTKVAVAVVIEESGAAEVSGNGLAAPIAKAVMEAVLGR